VIREKIRCAAGPAAVDGAVAVQVGGGKGEPRVGPGGSWPPPCRVIVIQRTS